MSRIMTVAATAALMAGAAQAPMGAEAAPIPNAGLSGAASAAFPLEEAQYVYGGRNYCWYGNGWRGPGWYWCGYAWNRGYGWGGGYGWNGWRGGVWRGGGWHGGGRR